MFRMSGGGVSVDESPRAVVVVDIVSLETFVVVTERESSEIEQITDEFDIGKVFDSAGVEEDSQVRILLVRVVA